MTNLKNIDSSLSKGAYIIYDTKLCIFDSPFIIEKSKLVDDLKYIVNTYGSKYYFHESDYIVYYVGDFDDKTGLISYCPFEQKFLLSELVDEKIRNKQIILHTLNTLPVGYHKMPEELRKEIQTGIDNAIKDYVSEFCDLDSLSSN